MLKEPGKAATSDKYMWVTLGGSPDEKSILFEYDKSRSGEIPLRLLDGFKGYLQTDGYAGYHEACRQYGLISLGCMDHARRKFKDAQDAQVKVKSANNTPTKADMVLSYINKLYVIERNIQDLSVQEKHQQRQALSVPVFNKLKDYLEKHQHKVLKNSLTGVAMTYLVNQWDKLTVYCSDGSLSISNILAENAIRPFVIGRKNWLFADTPAGAHASAVHYSLIETAKTNGLEPYAYLLAVLKKIPYAQGVEDYEALLPWKIKT